MTAETTVTVKLVPHEKGAALVLESALLRELGIDESTPISVTARGGSLIISRATAHATAEQVDAASAHVNKDWGGVLKKLAE